MLIAPLICGIIFIILAIASLFIFKVIFKIENFKGYLLGIIASAITTFSVAVLITISIFVLNVMISKNVENGSVKILINSINNIEELDQLPFLTLLVVWLFLAIIFIAIFLILFFILKIISKPEDDSNILFIFFSGYILIPSLLWYIFCILLSCELSFLSNLVEDEKDIFSNYFILVIELGGIFFLMLIAGTSMMVVLHHKEYNNLIIWCCIVLFYAPMIFYFFGFLTLLPFFFSFLNGACPILSLILGVFLFKKYTGFSSSNVLLGSKVEMGS